MLDGIINPPRIMEGRKMDWLNRGIARELGETTPINMPKLAILKAASSKISTKYPQFDGTPALKNGAAVNVMMIETIKI